MPARGKVSRPRAARPVERVGLRAPARLRLRRVRNDRPPSTRSRGIWSPARFRSRPPAFRTRSSAIGIRPTTESCCSSGYRIVPRWCATRRCTRFSIPLCSASSHDPCRERARRHRWSGPVGGRDALPPPIRPAQPNACRVAAAGRAQQARLRALSACRRRYCDQPGPIRAPVERALHTRAGPTSRASGTTTASPEARVRRQRGGRPLILAIRLAARACDAAVSTQATNAERVGWREGVAVLRRAFSNIAAGRRPTRSRTFGIVRLDVESWHGAIVAWE